ncbi:hypothetical protein G7046_g8252 [Stylonectria norvegica]|nr:hypothetical protein G7046_g8252 [Stylonectria norvegica]
MSKIPTHSVHDKAKPLGSLIRQATTPEDLASIVKCFKAYIEWLNEDISFQDYASELRELPGKYSPPAGALLLAVDKATDEVLGCIALRPLELQQNYRREDSDHVRYCEIKRLFVYPAARGRQIARTLIREAVQRAVDEGYDEILLDTLGRMKAAIGLYESEGFVETEPYSFNPLNGVKYFSKRMEPLV